MTNDEASGMFKNLRLGYTEKVACPSCSVIDAYYLIRHSRQWRCKECKRTYSVSSNTIFAFRRLPLKIYLGAIAIFFTNAMKGLSTIQMSRDLNVQYRTAFVRAHKIPESLIIHRDESQLAGKVHIDFA